MNNLSQVSLAHSFWVICQNISSTFVELCMETPYWCTNMAAGNQQKHLEFTFSIKQRAKKVMSDSPGLASEF